MTTTALPQTRPFHRLLLVRGTLRRILTFFAENRRFTAGVVLLLALYLFAWIGLQLITLKSADMGAVPLSRAPTSQFLFGTDGQGRDMFAVMVISIPNTLKVGFLAGTVGVVIGTLIGLLAGYYRGWADTFFSSFADVMLVIPTLAILITVSAYVRVVTVEIMAVIVGLLAWPLPARVIRSQTLSLRERLFVQVAKLSGQNDFEIIVLQILPNLTASWRRPSSARSVRASWHPLVWRCSVSGRRTCQRSAARSTTRSGIRRCSAGCGGGGARPW
jgi:peptide/nickel transport system permease protein